MYGEEHALHVSALSMSGILIQREVLVITVHVRPLSMQVSLLSKKGRIILTKLFKSKLL